MRFCLTAAQSSLLLSGSKGKFNSGKGPVLSLNASQGSSGVADLPVPPCSSIILSNMGFSLQLIALPLPQESKLTALPWSSVQRLSLLVFSLLAMSGNWPHFLLHPTPNQNDVGGEVGVGERGFC